MFRLMNAVSGIALAIALAAAPVAAQNVLRQEGILRVDQQIRSTNGRYHLIMQADCNLVLYESARALWATNTHGRALNCLAVMQSDGNLVVYSQGGNPLWASNTVGRTNPTLQVEDSGDLIIYSGGRAVWRSNTAQRPAELERPTEGEGRSGGGGAGRDRPWGGADVLRPGDELRSDREDSIASASGAYSLTVRRSCDVELQQSGWAGWVDWRSNTAWAGRRCRLVMRNSGELVLVADGRVVWGTGTSGRDVLAYVSRTGELILYDRDRNRELFNSRRDWGRRY